MTINFQQHKNKTSDVAEAMPHDKASELALLSLALNSETAYFELEDAGIKPEMFYSLANQYLYSVIGKLAESLKQHPPLFEVVSYLKRNNELNDDLYQTILQAGRFVVSSHLTMRHFGNVLEAYRKRECIRLALRLTEMAFDGSVSSEACTMFTNAANEAIERATRPLDVFSGQKLVDHMQEFYQNAANLPDGTSWGLPNLDRATRGTRLGELTVISAPPGHGKSALIHQTAYHRATTTNRAQLIITVGDMTKEQVVNRIIQQQTGVSAVDLSYGKFTTRDGFDHTRQVMNYVSRFTELPLYIVEGVGFTSMDVRRVFQSMLRLEPRWDGYVDYMQQLGDKGDIYERTSTISSNILACVNGLKDKAGSPAISLTALSSVNKTGEYFGASNIGHDVANNFGLKLDKPTDTEDFNRMAEYKATIKIEKQRYGPSGFKVALNFDGTCTRFSSEGAA